MFNEPSSNFIDTDKISQHLRNKAINLHTKQILITNFAGSDQEKDLSEPANCDGYGRIRHFKIQSSKLWVPNPLPILPASKSLGVTAKKEIRAQVFQNSVCNWRCWYCFVDYKLLSGDYKYANFLSADQLVDLYLKQVNPPPMIDLTGGQPDLTPEWVPWMMGALLDRGLQNKVFLWSDDNLSNDYLWRFLTPTELDRIANYKMYARVCCFKGIDGQSFFLNTKADPALFDRQFELCKRLLDLGIDLYCYITITASTQTDFNKVIPELFDRLQLIDEQLPLRIVPLEILEFTPMKNRMTESLRDAIKGQYLALKVWESELSRRFSHSQLQMPITEIKLGNDNV